MITRNNLLNEYPRILQNSLPKALQQDEFDFVAENFDLIDDDEDIAKFVDTFIKKLNEAIEKSGKQGKPDEKTKKTVTQPKSQKSSKQKREPKPKKEPKPKPPKPGNPVSQIPLEVVFIKSYCGWDGKVKTKTQVYTFIKRLQKPLTSNQLAFICWYTFSRLPNFCDNVSISLLTLLSTIRA